MPLDDTTKHYALAQEDTTADPFTDWLGTQRADERYCFMSWTHCPIARFIYATVPKWRRVLGRGLDSRWRYRLEEKYRHVLILGEQTYGAAYQRARAEALAKSEGRR